PPLLDQPFAATLGFARLGEAPLRLPQGDLGLLARVLRGAHALERVLDHAACHLLGLGGHALHASEPLALVALGEQPPDSLPYHAPNVLPGLGPHAPGARLLDHLIRPHARLARAQQVLLGSLGTGAGGIALNRQLLQLLLAAARQPCLRLGQLRRERRQPLLGARRVLGGVRGAACLQQSGALALGPLDPARQSLGAGPRLLLTQQQALE